ncbi:septal ring lytic transglycosylase RlpA family protein [Hyphomicrobium sp.]|uniref:septal ring lytic transglycosylase RlpA family protein n=1 Tax=Hyphomicrobium sp. TaxID=82 RepID=UPI001D31ABF4|nr:septal ring lytic transglycosylase RlpA family protein [Hyphomicrobium sp.]MBY0561754.1 septal ring lytic transglycosylase RlpA family protein [Hyphomicrobium sp.]
MRSTIAIAAFAFAGVTAATVPAMAASSHHKATYHKTSYHKASYQKHAHVSGRKATKKVAARKSVGGSGGSHGIASYYWQGQQTASGARFNPEGLTAAHRTLPFGTRVRVTNQSNGQSVVVTINDRGPFVGGRVIDLSRGAARQINMTGAGLARVSLEVLGRS